MVARHALVPGRNERDADGDRGFVDVRQDVTYHVRKNELRAPRQIQRAYDCPFS